jgi:stress response protein YsnF
MDTTRIPLAKEQAEIQVEPKLAGRVRVTTKTHEIEDRATATLEHSDLQVTRVPIDQVVDVAPEVRVEGDVTIVPVLEEVLVVEKRLVLKEELHIKRVRNIETVDVPVKLRKQEATIERIDGQVQETE